MKGEVQTCDKKLVTELNRETEGKPLGERTTEGTGNLEISFL